MYIYVWIFLEINYLLTYLLYLYKWYVIYLGNNGKISIIIVHIFSSKIYQLQDTQS